jgi:hypothetical protein
MEQLKHIKVGCNYLKLLLFISIQFLKQYTQALIIINSFGGGYKIKIGKKNIFFNAFFVFNKINIIDFKIIIESLFLFLLIV